MTHGSREQILELEARVVDVVVDVPLNDLWRHNEDEAKTIEGQHELYAFTRQQHMRRTRVYM